MDGEKHLCYMTEVFSFFLCVQMSLLSRRHHNHSGKSDTTWQKRRGDVSSPDYSEHIRALSLSLLPLEPVLFPN